VQNLHTQFRFFFLFVPAIGRVLAHQLHRFFALTALCALSGDAILGTRLV
jgi:hypothetical protein